VHRILQLDESGATTVRYLYGAAVDEILAVETVSYEDGFWPIEDGTAWALADNQGTVRHFYGADAQTGEYVVLDKIKYDTFGRPIDLDDNPTDGLDAVTGLYTGRFYDPDTGLFYYRARNYDPLTRTFTTEDPIGFSSGDTNLYRYVGNSPANYTDPSGQFLLGGLGIVGGIAIVGLLTAHAGYYAEAQYYDAAQDAAAEGDWDNFYAQVENARYSHAVGNIGVTTAVMAPVGFGVGAAFGVAGGVAASYGAGAAFAFSAVSVGAGVGMLTYSVGSLAVASADMDGPQRLEAWGSLGAGLVSGGVGGAVGYAAGGAAYAAAPGWAMSAMESRLGNAALRMIGPNRAASIAAALSPHNKAAASVASVAAGYMPKSKVIQLGGREANYLRRIQGIEAKYGAPGVHSLQKHGAQTTALSQYRRVSRPDYPNPTTGAAGNATKNASKFLSHRDHYETLVRGLRARVAGQTEVPVHFDRVIGINIRNLGTHANRGPYSLNRGVSSAVVRFTPDGKIISAFPNP